MGTADVVAGRLVDRVRCVHAKRWSDDALPDGTTADLFESRFVSGVLRTAAGFALECGAGAAGGHIRLGDMGEKYAYISFRKPRPY